MVIKRRWKLLVAGLVVIFMFIEKTTAQEYDLKAVDSLLASSLTRSGPTNTPLAGVSFVIFHKGTKIYERSLGSQQPDDVLPLASATKWMTGACLLALVENKILSLDDKISNHLPAFDTDEKRKITIRQCISHTSGLPERDISQFMAANSLQTVAERLALKPLRSVPGTKFAYGGASFDVVGAVAEKVTGKRWANLFTQYIAKPLHLTQTTYNARRGPLLGGGLSSTLGDYAKFLNMIYRKGTLADGTCVLKPESVEAMLQNQSGNLPVLVSPMPGGFNDYGVGCWREKSDSKDRIMRVSSPGAFGTYPWIDFENEYFAVLLTRDRLSNVRPLLTALRDAVVSAIKGTKPKSPSEVKNLKDVQNKIDTSYFITSGSPGTEIARGISSDHGGCWYVTGSFTQELELSEQTRLVSKGQNDIFVLK